MIEKYELNRILVQQLDKIRRPLEVFIRGSCSFDVPYSKVVKRDI